MKIKRHLDNLYSNLAPSKLLHMFVKLDFVSSVVVTEVCDTSLLWWLWWCDGSARHLNTTVVLVAVEEFPEPLEREVACMACKPLSGPAAATAAAALSRQ